MDELITRQDISYEVLSTVTPGVVRDIDALLPQMSEEPPTMTAEYIQRIIDSGTQMLVARAGDRIVGTACLVVAVHPRRIKGWVEDVIVDESFRGKGIAQEMMRKIIDMAREHDCDNLNLTSKPRRASAHSVYESFGFQKRDVNVYRLSL
jgi:GNAT superfamily N-acetyltransferase